MAGARCGAMRHHMPCLIWLVWTVLVLQACTTASEEVVLLDSEGAGSSVGTVDRFREQVASAEQDRRELQESAISRDMQLLETGEFGLSNAAIELAIQKSIQAASNASKAQAQNQTKSEKTQAEEPKPEKPKEAEEQKADESTQKAAAEKQLEQGRSRKKRVKRLSKEAKAKRKQKRIEQRAQVAAAAALAARTKEVAVKRGETVQPTAAPTHHHNSLQTDLNANRTNATNVTKPTSPPTKSPTPTPPPTLNKVVAAIEEAGRAAAKQQVDAEEAASEAEQNANELAQKAAPTAAPTTGAPTSAPTPPPTLSQKEMRRQAIAQNKELFAQALQKRGGHN